MVEKWESAEVIRKQWVISFAQRRIQRELPGPQGDGRSEGEREWKENMV